MKICGHLSTHMLSLRIYLQNDQKWIINNDYGPFGHHFLVCPEIKEGVPLSGAKTTGLHFTVIELSFKILSLYLSVPNKWTKIVKIHEPYRVSIRNVPQFLLNLLILSSLNLYRNVFVFQMELWIPPFKGSMSQPASSMFVAGEIKQNCGTSFYGHPVPTELHPLKPLIFLPFLFKSASTVQGVKMAKKKLTCLVYAFYCPLNPIQFWGTNFPSMGCTRSALIFFSYMA